MACQPASTGTPDPAPLRLWPAATVKYNWKAEQFLAVYEPAAEKMA